VSAGHRSATDPQLRAWCGRSRGCTSLECTWLSIQLSAPAHANATRLVRRRARPLARARCGTSRPSREGFATDAAFGSPTTPSHCCGSGDHRRCRSRGECSRAPFTNPQPNIFTPAASGVGWPAPHLGPSMARVSGVTSWSAGEGLGHAVCAYRAWCCWWRPVRMGGSFYARGRPQDVRRPTCRASPPRRRWAAAPRRRRDVFVGAIPVVVGLRGYKAYEFVEIIDASQ